MRKALSQEEIDAVFERTGPDASPEPNQDIAPFDLNHLDRIPKSQLRALHLVHENFVRNLASSLSAYLRSYVALNLVSLEQISYAVFCLKKKKLSLKRKLSDVSFFQFSYVFSVVILLTLYLICVFTYFY